MEYDIILRLWNEYKKDSESVPDEKRKKLRARVVDSEDNFCDMLNTEEEALFELYDSYRSEEEEYRAFSAFRNGAALALKFAMEVLK